MASIVIREVDNTSAGISAANTDIAYVPGYAINGPVNVPTLCESLEDFQAIFGYKPYEFKTNQAYPSEFKSSAGTKTAPKTLMYEAGDYEKSYIYAAELLKLGLPVLFERVLPTRLIDGVEVSEEDMTAKLYFTASKGMLNYDQIFGSHVIDLGNQTAIAEKTITFLSEKTPIVPGSVSVSYTIEEVDYIITDKNLDGNLFDADGTNMVGTVEYDTGLITINADAITEGTIVACICNINNIYVAGSGDLVYESIEGNAENVILVVTAKTVGATAKGTTINYHYEQAKFANEVDYFEFTVTPSAELYGEAPIEKIRFTNNLDDVNLEIPEPIYYYRDITSQYVNFEWLQELDYMAESSVPDAINVLGNTWSDFGALDSNPNYRLGSYALPIGAGKKYYSTLQSNYKSITVNMSKAEFEEHADEYADYSIVMQARRPDNGWTTPTLKPTDGRLATSNPEIIGVDLEDLMFNAENPGVFGESMNFLWCGGTVAAPLSDSLFTGLSTDDGASCGQEFGVEFKFSYPTYVDTLDLFATHGLSQIRDNNIAVFIKTEEQPDYSNKYIEESVKYSLGVLNGHLGVAHGEFVKCYNKELGYDPKVRTNFIIGKDDVNKKFTLKIKEKVVGIRIVGLYKMTIEGGMQHQFYINGVNMYSEHGTVDETSPLLIKNEYIAGDEFEVENLYDTLSQATFWDYADRLTAKGEYDFKYLTTGAYPVFEYNDNIIANNMIQCAKERGDATAYIDHTNDKLRTCIASKPESAYKSFVDYMRNQGNDYSIYAAMFTPWYRSTCGTVGQILEMPASFAYLSAMAKMIQDKPNFLAVAGVERGSIPNFVASTQLITNAMADSYQPRNDVSFNAITNIKPYGYVIWGNRTGKNNAVKGNLTAQSFLNIRQMCSDIKKTIYTAAKTLTFEQNTDILWVNFKSKVSPLLDKMITGNGINGYKFIKKATTEKAKIVAVIKIYPIEPVEDWDVTIELSDAGVVVE